MARPQTTTHKSATNLRAAYKALKAKISAAQVVTPPEGITFRDPFHRPKLWEEFLTKLEDADGKAIRLEVSKVPQGLKNAARKEGLRIEVAECDGYILVRCTGLLPNKP